MDFDTIDYYFDTIESFYAELDDILNRPYSTEHDAKRITTQYIRFLVRYSNQFLKTTAEFDHATYKLIDSKLCLDHSTTILSHILHSHVLSSQDKDELLISYSILLYAGKDEPRWMDFILSESIENQKNRLFCKIMTEVRLGFYDSYKLLGASFSLAYELCKLAPLHLSDIDSVDISIVNYLLDLVEQTRHDALESFNYDVIRLIMVLNEQYMMSGLNVNLVIQVLSQRIGTSETFSANLIFMLNRSKDTCIQLLILKLLYAIFTRSTLYEYFYTNDLYVLVDITLRELCGLGETKESQTLRDAYLRVLEPLLENTQLRLEPYKKQETYKVLQSLINPGMQRKVHPTTKRIVKRIMEDWWEKICSGEDMVHSPASFIFSSASSGPSTPLDDHPIENGKISAPGLYSVNTNSPYT